MSFTEHYSDENMNIVEGSFTYAEVSKFVSLDSVLIRAIKRDHSDILKYYNILSPERAMEYAETKRPTGVEGDLFCEIVYMGEIVTGYYIPCYRIYVPIEAPFEDSAVLSYQSVVIPMIDYSELTVK